MKCMKRLFVPVLGWLALPGFLLCAAEPADGPDVERVTTTQKRVRIEVGGTGGDTGRATIPQVKDMGVVSTAFALAVKAIRGGDDKLVDNIFMAYRDQDLIHEKDAAGRTLVHYAAGQGDLKVLRAVLSKRPDVSVRDSGGRTALFPAADGAYNDNARLLVAAGVDPNVVDHGGVTALQLAADHGKPEMAQILLQAGAQVDYANAGGVTALMYAAQRGNLSLVKVLQRYGANAALRDKGGNTALHYACRWSRPDLIQHLLAGQNIRNAAGLLPRELALDVGCQECITVLNRFATRTSE